MHCTHETQHCRFFKDYLQEHLTIFLHCVYSHTPSIGSFSDDDGLLSKTTTFHVHHAFLYISLPSLHDYDVKMPNFTFYGGRKQATTNFSFPF